MEAATTHSGSARIRPVRAFRRRRAALGAGIAVAAVVALGVGFAGAKDPSLQEKISAARSDAGQLSSKVNSQTAQIASLTAQAHAAGSRAMVLNAQVQNAEARSSELAKQLDTAQRQLDQLRGEYADSVKQLDQRLVAIYESDAPDYVTVLLNSKGFDDLSTRTDYLNALHDADRRIADRAASLRDQMAEHTHQVADLKQQSDAQAQQLSADKASFLASEQAANRGATAVAAARSGTQAPALAGSRPGRRPTAADRSPAGGRRHGRRRARISRRPVRDPDLHRHLRVGRQLPGAERVKRSRRRVPDPALDLARLRRPGRTAGRAQGRAGPDRRRDLARLRAERLVLRLADLPQDVVWHATWPVRGFAIARAAPTAPRGCSART